MLRLLWQGRAQGVLIHKIDRSARNLKDWADLGELIDRGVEVHIANEALDLNSRSGRLSADIQAVVAADYIRNLREETKKGLYGRLKQGFYPLPAPIGYLDHGAAKLKTIDPTKGPLVRQAFELYASGQFSIDALVEELFRLGLRNRSGGKFTRNGLCVMFRNPFYFGLIRVKATRQTFPGNHESLISRQLYDEVQDVMDGRLTARARRHDFLFRKTVRCGFCGRCLIAELQKGHVYYRCHQPSCHRTCIREDSIDEVIKASLARLALTDKEKQTLMAKIAWLKQNWIESRKQQEATLALKIEKTTERLSRLTDAFLDQTLDQTMYEEKKLVLLRERQDLTEALRALNSGRSIPEELGKIVELAGSAILLYQSAIPEEKRRLVKIVSSNFALRQKTLDFAFSKPFGVIAMRERYPDGAPSSDFGRTLDDLIAALTAELSAAPLSAT